MSDYLTNLVARSLGSAPALRPRLRSWFEPAPGADRLDAEIFNTPVAEMPPAVNAPPESLPPRIANHDTPDPNAPVDFARAQPLLPTPFDVAAINPEATIITPAPRPPVVLRPIQADQFPASMTAPRVTVAAPEQATAQVQPSTWNDADITRADEVARPAAPMTQPIVQTPPAHRAPTTRQQAKRQSETEPQTAPTPVVISDALTRPVESLPMPPAARPIEIAARDADVPALEQTAIVARPRVTPLLADRSTVHPRAQDEPTAAPAPTVQVTIGRIEVRAAVAAPAAPKARSTPATQSLDDYLRRRSHGGAP